MTDFDKIFDEYKDFEDFGFTEVSEEDFEKKVTEEVSNAILETEKNTVEQYQQKLKEVEALILPFLIKLMNAKEVYIKWPHEVREPMIKSQIEKIVKITRGHLQSKDED